MRKVIKTKRLEEKNLVFKVIFCFVFLLLTTVISGCATNKPYCHINSLGRCDVSGIGESTLSSNGAVGYPLNDFAGNPIRRGENVQQIWIGPYEDKDGNFHEASYVYAVVKDGSWIGDPEKAVQDQD